MQAGSRARERPRGRAAGDQHTPPPTAPLTRAARGGEGRGEERAEGDGTGARAGGHGTDGRAGRRAGGAGKRTDARARPRGGVVTEGRGRETGDGRGERRGEGDRRGERRTARKARGCGGANPAVAHQPPGPPSPRASFHARPTERLTPPTHSLSHALSLTPPTPHTASSTQPRDAPAATSDGRRAPRSTNPHTPTAGSGAGTERGAAAARGKAREIGRASCRERV